MTQEVLKVKFPNGNSIDYAVVFKELDSLNGKVHAVFAADTSVTAYMGSFVNGKQNGVFLYYYPSGSYHQTCIYGYGNLHGDYTVYNEEGKIVLKGQYKNGLKHGYWRDLDKNLIGRYYKGKRHLKWKITNPKGRGVKESWVYFRGVLRKGDAKTAEMLRL
jgi:antitoxin component YwqK of YwqJK toxin-antitoxin module